MSLLHSGCSRRNSKCIMQQVIPILFIGACRVELQQINSAQLRLGYGATCGSDVTWISSPTAGLYPSLPERYRRYLRTEPALRKSGSDSGSSESKATPQLPASHHLTRPVSIRPSSSSILTLSPGITPTAPRRPAPPWDRSRISVDWKRPPKCRKARMFTCSRDDLRSWSVN